MCIVSVCVPFNDHHPIPSTEELWWPPLTRETSTIGRDGEQHQYMELPGLTHYCMADIRRDVYGRVTVGVHMNGRTHTHVHVHLCECAYTISNYHTTTSSWGTCIIVYFVYSLSRKQPALFSYLCTKYQSLLMYYILSNTTCRAQPGHRSLSS